MLEAIWVGASSLDSLKMGGGHSFGVIEEGTPQKLQRSARFPGTRRCRNLRILLERSEEQWGSRGS